MRTFSPESLRLMSWGASLLLASTSIAQVPDAPGGPAPAAGGGATATAPAAQPAAQNGAGGGQKGSFLGKDVPSFDPGTEIMTWDGKNWNVNNNRLFQARFEKYLNAPEETTAVDRQYQTVINNLLTLLAPGNATTQNIDAAFRLLPRGSSFDIDARLCDSIADAVYSAWRAQNAQNRLASANDALDSELKQEYWNAQHASVMDGSREASSTGSSSKQKGGGKSPSSNQSYEDNMIQVEHTKRIAEIEAVKKANSVKRELNSIQAKVEFQALILQFFLQRRFQHVLIATRFYRAVFTDGDTKLNVGKDTKDLFEKSSGLPPTVGTIDSMANEALRDVREGVQAYNFLLEKQELESATKRLGEAFTVGEFVPEIRTLPREKKRKALEFAHKTNQLVSAIDVKDYTLAESLVKDLGVIAKDFDSSKPMAAIDTSKQISDMHLAKARNAALKGDNATLEAELTAATELWPRNPALAELSKKIFQTGDIQQKAVIDFEQLLSQKNYRQIFDDRARFIGALAFYPDKAAKLKEVLDNVQTIEVALMRADEMVRQNNYPGAWESVEKIAQQFPDDTKLSKTRADLTPHAADFVRTLQDAQDMEKRDQVGSSLAYYLKARKIYPASDFAGEGVDRLVKKIVPDSNN
ncbi:hypothetical protein EV701_103175 [Chthoniobacter flavus]|nr:hypothetical protein [Chthoniobacter flavus]TCO94088.1 hypothetical protein EV701_103175 [Chthoniobacter flavus]